MPNILLIALDDCYDFHRHRNSWGVPVNTPHLDALIASGCHFTSAYSPIQVCHPSRTAVMSGFTPWQTGILNNNVPIEERLTLDQLWVGDLKKAGFHTWTSGKIYHAQTGTSTEPYNFLAPLYDKFTTAGFSQTPDANVHSFNDYGTAESISGGRGFLTGTSEFYDSQVATEFESFIASYSSAKPFYAEVGFYHPHTPRDAPNSYFQAVNFNAITPPAAWESAWDLSQFVTDHWITRAGAIDPPSQWSAGALNAFRTIIRNYIACLLFVDFNIGRVMTALTNAGFANDTVVVLFSDHGYEIFSHARDQKNTLWEQACAVPLIVKDPASTPRVNANAVSLMDIGPTILDYAGLTPPSHHVGKSLKPTVETGAAPPSRMIMSAFYGMVSGRTDTHRITAFPDGTFEYYDIANDEWAQDNLANNPTVPASFTTDKEALLQQCLDWGVKIVEGGIDLGIATPLTHYLGTQIGDIDNLPNATGVMGYASLNADRVGQGYQRAWLTPSADAQILIAPSGVEEIGVPLVDTEFTAFTIRGNRESNEFNVETLSAAKTTTIHMGDGDDVLSLLRGSGVLHLGPGDDDIRVNRASTVYGGQGNDSLNLSGQNDTVYGGAGADTIQADGGADVIYAGPGADVIDTGDGDDTVHLDGGANTVTLGGGTNTVVLYRTGMPQTIKGFVAGTVIDCADWSGLSPVSVFASSADTIIVGGLERITVTSALPADVATAITGVVANVS